MNLKLARLFFALVFFILVSEAINGQGDTEVCVGSALSYTATPSDQANALQWYITPGDAGVDWYIDSENTSETSIEWLRPGTYTLRITETDGEGVETVIAPYPLIVTVHSLPVATIDYAGSPYCASGTAAVTITGLVTGGEFTSTESLLIDPHTGEIDCAASIPDTYFVTYTFTDGYCYNTATAIVTINPLPDATISYPLSPYCPSGTASPELTGITVGNYNSTTGLSIISSTGVINLDSSTPGTYTVTYNFTNGICSNNATAEITIQVLTTTTIEYPGSPYCGSGAALVTLTGLAGGIYSGGSGLIIDNTTGTVDLTASSPGTYTVNYDYTDGVCSDLATTEITISDPLTATISYPEIPVCATGSVSVVFNGEPGGSFSSSEGLSVNISSGSINLDASIPGTYTVVYTFGSGSCTYTTSETVTINARPGLPAAAGALTGPATFTQGDAGVAYNIDLIEGAVSYVWSYSGSGVIVNQTGISNITLDFSSSATEGFLTVKGLNLCGLEGPETSYELKYDSKTLNLTSVLLQGLYESGGVMRQAWNATGPQFSSGIADHITVELHEAISYSSIAQTVNNVPLSTTGSAEVILPGTITGSYYITIKHRNSIETTTAAAVSFAGSAINQSFGSKANIYGGNLGDSPDGRYLIFAGDVNQDDIVDAGDMNDVDNGSTSILFGYNASDANSDGLVDSSDMNIIDNNSTTIVMAYIPF